MPTTYSQSIQLQFHYPVVFSEGIFARENRTLVDTLTRLEPRRQHRALVVVDQNLARARPLLEQEIVDYFAAFPHELALAAPPVRMVGGEAAKEDPAVPASMQARLFELALDRQSFVVMVGGGALLDVVGYAAATVHRGLRVVRIPTTVLSQADSGVGVKNGVNRFGKKNFVGTFWPPFAVLCDAQFLGTLDRRNTLAGMAEAVKVALIRDADFFYWLERNAVSLSGGNRALLTNLIERSAKNHLEHIATSGDPFELGSARPLDFGHWIAHRLEALTKGQLLHGEAVAIGMAADTVYSRRAGLCSQEIVERILGVLRRVGLALWHEQLADPTRIWPGLGDFREHLGGDLTITLLAGIGQAIEVREMRQDWVTDALAELRTCA